MRRSLAVLPPIFALTALASAQQSVATRYGDNLSSVAFGLALWQWFGLLILLVASLLAASIAQIVVRRVRGLRERFLGSKFGKQTVQGFRRGTGFLVLTLVWYAALPEIS